MAQFKICLGAKFKNHLSWTSLVVWRKVKMRVAQSCLTLCNPTDCNMPGFPVHHQLPELAQTHVHLVSDAIQLFHLLSSRSLPAFNLSQHQGLFQWVRSSHQVAKVLEFQLSASVLPMNIQLRFPLVWTGLVSLQFRGLSRVQKHLQHHSTTVQKHQFFRTQLSEQLSQPYVTTGKTITLTVRNFASKKCLCFLICCLGLTFLFFQGASIF